MMLKSAYDSGKKFRVVVVDSRPMREGITNHSLSTVSRARTVGKVGEAWDQVYIRFGELHILHNERSVQGLICERNNNVGICGSLWNDGQWEFDKSSWNSWSCINGSQLSHSIDCML
jgi:hypothetical protein